MNIEMFARTVIIRELNDSGFYCAKNLMVQDALNAQCVLGKHTVDIWITRSGNILFIHKRVDATRETQILKEFTALKRIDNTDKPQMFVQVDVTELRKQTGES